MRKKICAPTIYSPHTINYLPANRSIELRKFFRRVVHFILMNQKKLKAQTQTILPTDWGRFKIIAYARKKTEPMPHLAFVSEIPPDLSSAVLVRIHSECMTGDVFGSHRCDCGQQLHEAFERIHTETGVLVYLRQEGRGIGLINKLKAYELQDAGMNTAEANVHLGFEEDARHYDDAIAILKDLGITKIRLLTNNPLKINELQAAGIQVIAREPIVIAAQQDNKKYLDAKRNLMGHLI